MILVKNGGFLQEEKWGNVNRVEVGMCKRKFLKKV